MQVVNPQLIHGKKVILRLDIDVPIKNGKVIEDFRLRAGLPTLKLCLEHAGKVIAMGHIGRPRGKEVPELSVESIRQWFPKDSKLTILENLRFDPREEACDLNYAKELAGMGDVYVNEAFASYRPSSSTTVLPTLLPAFAGLRFAREVGMLKAVRENPKKPFIAIMGGAKVADKLPVIQVLAKSADAVLVGGKLIGEIRDQKLDLPKNVLVGMLTGDGLDIAPQTTTAWSNLISRAKMIVWNGPLGKFEEAKNDQTKKIAEMVLDSGAEVIIGGGDSVAALSQYGLLDKAEKLAFVSVGGGAMLKLLADGTLPTIEAMD